MIVNYSTLHSDPRFTRFVKRGKVVHMLPCSSDPIGGWAVECGKHPEAGLIPVFVDIMEGQSRFWDKVNESFDSCPGCKDLEAREIKKEFKETRWPEGAEL